MRTGSIFLIIFSISIVLFSCKTENLKTMGTNEYIEEVERWHQKRIENLKKETEYHYLRMNLKYFHPLLTSIIQQG